MIKEEEEALVEVKRINDRYEIGCSDDELKEAIVFVSRAVVKVAEMLSSCLRDMRNSIINIISNGEVCKILSKQRKYEKRVRNRNILYKKRLAKYGKK